MYRITQCFLTVAVLCLTGRPAGAGGVEGVVHNLGATQPKDGLSRVDVKITPDNGLAPTETDPDGFYQFKDVPNGDYTLEFDRVGYSRRHLIIKVTVKDAVHSVDARLMPDRLDAESLHIIANRFVKIANDPGDSKTKVFAGEWDELRDLNVQPSTKLALASLIDERDKDASEMEYALKQYMQTDAKGIGKVQLAYKDVLLGKGDGPTKEFVTDNQVGDMVHADIVLYCLRTTKVSKERKVEFLKEFNKEWEGTPAVEAVMQGLKNDTQHFRTKE